MSCLSIAFRIITPSRPQVGLTVNIQRCARYAENAPQLCALDRDWHMPKDNPTINARRRVRLFKNGPNQAVRIPREFELPGDEAILSKEGDRLVIEPIRQKSLLDAGELFRPKPRAQRRLRTGAALVRSGL
jgi:antitoxin VapB